MTARTTFRLRDIHGRTDRACIDADTELFFLLDSTGAMVGYVSTVEIDDLTSATQDRIIQRTTVAAAG